MTADDLRYPVPDASIFEGVAQYIPLLLAAVDAELGFPGVWPDDEAALALEYVEDVRAWLQELEGYLIPIGGLVPFFGATVPPSYLLCDGSTVNKIDYPDLYAVLAGNVPETTNTFDLPDMRLHIPMGAGIEANPPDGATAVDLDVLGETGLLHVTLTPGNTPPHRHTIGAHTHTTQEHNHDQTAHTHALNDPGHTHTTNTRQTSGAGAQARVMTSNNSGTDSTLATSSQTTGVSVVNQTATNQPATVSVNASSAYQSGETGQALPFDSLPPVVGVNYLIRAK